MTTNTTAAQTAHTNPLSDEYVNAVIQQHGYQSPETVIARLNQWIGLHGGENGVTLLMYEAHKALVKLRASVADEDDQPTAPDDDAIAECWVNASDCDGIAYDGPSFERGYRAALAIAPVAGEAQPVPIPSQRPSGVLSMDGASLHMQRDGSGRIIVAEDDFTLEDDRGEGPDGPQGSVHWVARLPASELTALRDFLTGRARPSDDALWDQTLTERDEYHDMADKLANAIADHLLVEIGEHSSSNCPWMRALEAIENAAPQASKPDFSDAYEGAREDLAIWKRRALEAENLLRIERETSCRLVAELNATNGPTHKGEPAPQASEAELKEAAAIARSFGAPDMADALDPAKRTGLDGEAVRDAALTPLLARALAEWHEDDGPVTWWAWCGHEWAGEAPWCGTPLDQDWPGYHTHWTPIPGVPAALSAQPEQS